MIYIFLAVREDKSEEEDEELENNVAEVDEDEGIISIFFICFMKVEVTSHSMIIFIDYMCLIMLCGF